MCHILAHYPTHMLKNLTPQVQHFLDIHHQVVAPGLTCSELTHQRHPHPISLIHCKLFTPKICCPSTASCSPHHFCFQSYLVCPVCYSVLFQWKLSFATPWPSCPHFIRALTCEDTSGPVSLGVQHWLKCITGLEPVCLAWDTVNFLRLSGSYVGKHFYTVTALICFDKDTVLIKLSELCFCSLMKAFISTSWACPCVYRLLYGNEVIIKLGILCHCCYYYLKISDRIGTKCRNSIPLPSLPEPVKWEIVQKRPNNAPYSLTLLLLQNNCTSCCTLLLK